MSEDMGTLKEVRAYLLLSLLFQLLQPPQPLLLLPLGSLLLLQTTTIITRDKQSQYDDCVSQKAPPPSSWPELPAWPSLWPCWGPSSSPSPSPPSLLSSSSCPSSSCHPRPHLQNDAEEEKHVFIISLIEYCTTKIGFNPLIYKLITTIFLYKIVFIQLLLINIFFCVKHKGEK